MNQITVRRLVAGGLTPAFYYDALHNSYQKTAAKKNKQFFRTMAGVSAYQQVDVADSIKASLTQRAEIEALNIADRQIDIAWLAEGNKINSKLSDFQANIDRIVSVGGSVSRQDTMDRILQDVQDSHQGDAGCLYAQCPAQTAVSCHL